MKIELKVPDVGESVKEAILAEWLKNEGDRVEKDEPVFVVETDKVTLEVPAEQSGILHILVAAGETVAVGQVVGTIDTEAGKSAEEKKPSQKPDSASETPAEPGRDVVAQSRQPAPKPEAEPAPKRDEQPRPGSSPEAPGLMPSVRRLVREKGIDVNAVKGTGPAGRVTKADVMLFLESAQEGTNGAAASEETTRKPMSPIRKRIAENLLEAVQNTAMLTTFNEIDMSRVMELRDRFGKDFQERYGVRLGFMSFFIRAVTAALSGFPEINARIDGDHIVYHHYCHIGIAIGRKKGLVVPVIRHADRKSFAELESEIAAFAEKAEQNRLELSDLQGGTFSITNGGIFGSLLSTPILNIPQSAILGMHKIEKRPVVIDDQVVIRPMMYVALSYDHRIVDGREAVTFLRRVKEFLETPERMIMEI